MKTIYITEEQKKKLKKAIAAQDQVGGKVNAGVMDAVVGIGENVESDTYKLGAENSEFSPYYHINESDEEIITLYHGVNRKGLEYNTIHGGFVPRVCSEGGPKAVWLSEKQYHYEFTFAFDFPKSVVHQLSNVDYIYENKIEFHEFNCRLIKTSIYTHLDNRAVIETDIVDDRLSKIQFRYFPDLGIKLWKSFKDFPNVLDVYINPYIEKYQKLSESKLNESAVDLEYHYTTLQNLISMMATDTFNLTDSKGEEGRKGDYYMSLTRMRSNAEGYGYGLRETSPLIRIELDGRLLNNIRNVDITPYDYIYANYEHFKEEWGDDLKRGRGRTDGGESNEAEDSLTLRDGSDQIVDASNYINRIDILLGNHVDNIKLWDKFLKRIETYPDWGEKMHFFTNMNDFNYQRNEIPRQKIYSIYSNQLKGMFEGRKKVIKNDKGEIVPEKCDKCGGKVVLQIHGEPVYICKDCGKYFGTMPFTLKENKLNESIEDLEDVFEEKTHFELLNDFSLDKKHGIKQKQWNLIPAQQYHTLLKRYMESPIIARIPYNVVNNWFLNIIVPNAIDINNITDFAGHSGYFPSEDVSDYFGVDIEGYGDGCEYLDSIGFYDWCVLPDGSDAWSDYGLKPLFDIINLYNPNMEAGEILILINRCLDVVHQRGDLSSAFIEGGKHSCDYISNSVNENKLNENSNDRKINNYIKQKFGLTNFQDIRNKVMEVYKVIPYARIFSGRYLLGVFRLLFEDKIPRNEYTILNKVLYTINHNWYNIGQHLDNNLNNLSIEELINFTNLDVSLSPKINYVEKTRKVGNGYTITHVDSFEEMDLLCDGEWCISHDESTWDEIISEETVYLVQNEQMIEKFDIDYEQNKEKWDEIFDSIEYMDDSELGSYKHGGTPYDLYGLSRFVVLVSDWGISSCYSRYNIPNCLDGDFLNEKQLSELLGVNAEEAFPYIKPEEINENIEVEDKWNGDKEKLEPLKRLKIVPPVLYHASYKKNRESILKNGIYASVGFEYSNWWSYNGPNGEIPDDDELEYLVFLSTKPTTWSDNFYLDTMDIYEIDTKQLDKNCFYLDPTKDLALKGSICYTGNIPPSAIKLYDTKYFGKSVNENIEVEIAPEEVDLSSFSIKKKLNPKFWVDEHLDSRIRLKLLDISDDFIEYLGIDPNIVKDIIMTGSLANYNWNEKYSDIDLHVLLDYSDVDENVEFVKQYFMAQKTAWNNEHKDLKIFGFPIEVYVQDINEKHDSSGVYSLDRDKWLREPDRDVLATSKVNKSYIKDKVSEYTDKIDKLVYLYKKSKNDEYKLNKVYEKANKLWDEIKNSRKIGFEKSGGKEVNNENVIFKCLRRNKFLDKLYNLKTKTYDKLNSML